MKRMIATMLCLALTVGTLAGCASKPAQNAATGSGETQAESNAGETTGEKKITFVMGSEPPTIDPTMNNYAASSTVLQNLFVGLYMLDQEGEVIPGCAESVKISDDGLVYTYTLKDGLKWSDGTDLTAEDFEYAWKHTLDPETASPGAGSLYYLKNGEAYNDGTGTADDVGVKALDEKTLEVTLENPTAYFLSLSATTSYFPVKKDVVEGEEAWTKSADTYVSNGAFMMLEIKPQEGYSLLKNPNYVYADTVNLDALDIVFIESQEAALAAFNAGEVDVLDKDNVGSQAISQYSGKEELTFFDAIGTVYYDFNCSKDYLSDARVRKALSMAIDRDTINQNLVPSKPKSTNGYVPYGIPYGDTDQEFRDVAGDLIVEDVEQAKALLAEAGYPNGEGFPTITIITQPSPQEQKDIVQAMQAMWKENLGINSEIVTYESKVYWDEHSAGNFDVAYDGWTGDYLDASTNLNSFTTAKVADENRWSGELAEKYNDLVVGARTITDNSVRMEMFLEAEQILLDELPIMPLYYRNAPLLVNSRCKNVVKNFIGHTLFKFADVE